MDFFDRYFFRSAGMLFTVLMIVVTFFALCITVASKNTDYGLRVFLVGGSFSATVSLLATAWGRHNGVIPLGDDEIEDTARAGIKALKRFSPFIAMGFAPSIMFVVGSGSANPVYISAMVYALAFVLSIVFILPFIVKVYFITE